MTETNECQARCNRFNSREQAQAEVAGPQEAEAEEEAMEEQHIPEFQSLHQRSNQQDKRNALFVGEMQLTERSGVNDLKETAGCLKLSTSGSKSKTFNRTRDCYEQSFKRRALEVARQDYAKLCAEPRFIDAPVQPSERERKLPDVLALAGATAPSRLPLNH